MQLLLLLAAMIVARSQSAQWMLQQRGESDNNVMAGEKELKSATDQILRAYAGEQDLQKLLRFEHTPLFKWVPATKKNNVLREMLDNADDQEDPSLRQQVLQAATKDSENELLSRLLQLYDLLPDQTSKWRKRRRRQDEEVQPGSGTAGLTHQCHVAALDCIDNSSSATSPAEPRTDEVHIETKPDITQSDSHLNGRTEDNEKTAYTQEQSSSDGRVKRETDDEQTGVGEGPQNDYALNKLRGSSWGEKRAVPFSVVGAAWRRTFNSWGGKRNPSFHSWGGKRSNSFAFLGNGRSWGATTDPSLGSEKESAMTIMGSRRYRPAIFTITEEPTFTVLTSKNKQAPSFVSPGRDAAFSIPGGKSNPAFKILGNHDSPALSILGTTYETTPAYKRHRTFGSWGGKRASVFSSWGGKRAVEMPDQKHQGKFLKRGPKFSSWGGKRNFDDDIQEKRVFSSWGGKRNSISDYITQDIEEKIKRGFSSWGGKRDITKIEQNLQNSPSRSTKISKGEHGSWESEKERRDTSTQALAEAYQQLLETSDCKIQFRCEDNDKRKGLGEETEAGSDTDTVDPAAEYHNSHSSEMHGENAEHELLSTIMKRSDATMSGRMRVSKALFNPWGGKRSQVVPSLVTILAGMHRVDGSLNKRASTQYETLGSKKWGPSPSGSVFSSWGGKRSDKLTGHSIHKAPLQSIGRQFRRGADFYSWGGKR